MTHTYKIQGMTCYGCRNHVENVLSKIDGVTEVNVDLVKAEAEISMVNHIPLETFQEELKKDGGTYSIYGQEGMHAKHETKKPIKGKGTGVFYCPMHCEGDKTYDQPGECPVCGMALVEEQTIDFQPSQEWTCPMHPEIIKDAPGECPICGMDLVPKEADISAEEKNYKMLLKKFKIAAAFTLPIFLIAMSDMLDPNPLMNMLKLGYWNWIQFGYHCLWFFMRPGCFSRGLIKVS